MTTPRILAKTSKLITDNSPLILTALGVTGTLATAFLTGQATIKATRLLDDESQARHIRSQEPVTPKERFQLVWKLYIPATATCILTVSAIIGANRIGTRRAAALATAYTLSQRAFDEYSHKVIEKFGEKSEREIRDEVAQDRATIAYRDNPPAPIQGDDGLVWCLETMTGRWWRSNMETLNRAENSVNSQILHNDYATLSDFYEYVSDRRNQASILDDTDMSAEVGWNTDKNLDLTITPVMYKDREPGLAVSYTVLPLRDPSSFPGFP